MDKYIKNILVFLLLFFFIYLDPIFIGPIKWAQLWKLTLLFFGIRIIFVSSNTYKLPFLYLIFSLNYLISYSTIYYPSETLHFLITHLFFPVLLFYFFFNKKFLSLNYTISFLSLVSVFIILSSLPFLFNIIPTLGRGYSLGAGGYSDIFGYSGLFQTPHSASTITAYASITALFLFVNTRGFILKAVFFSLFLFSAYLVLITYVRTGMLMLVVGIYLFLIFKKKVNKLVLVLPVVIVITSLIYFQIKENKPLQDRIRGENIYAKDKDLDSASSGRLSIYKSSFKSFVKNKSPFEITFGIGMAELKRRNYENIGASLFAHNGFINILVTNGVLGFIIYLIFLFSWLKQSLRAFKISNKTGMHEGRYALSIFFAYISFMMTQGGSLIYESVFIGLSIMVSRNIIKSYVREKIEISCSKLNYREIVNSQY